MLFFLGVFKKHWAGILLLTLIGGAGALVVSLTQTPLYESTARLLVLQRTAGSLDAFTAARAAEKLGAQLARIIETSSFLEKVMAVGGGGPEDFPREEEERRAVWERMVRTEIEPNTSIMQVRVRQADRVKAERLVAAINTVLVSQSEEYVGVAGRDIVVSVVDRPLTSRTPVVPDIPKNVAAGVGIGLLLSVGSVMVRELIAQGSQRPVPATTLFPDAQGDLSAQRPSLKQVSELNVQADTVYVTKLKEVKEERGGVDGANRVHTMFDDVKAPFGGQYWFQNRLIEVGNGGIDH